MWNSVLSCAFYAPNFEEGAYYFCVICLYVHLSCFSCEPDILITDWARALKLGELTGAGTQDTWLTFEKKSDWYCESYVAF